MSLNTASGQNSHIAKGRPVAIASPAEVAASPVTALRLAIWAVLFQLAWNVKKIPGILHDGILPDPDDFLRLHQVRNWLSGQGWFDVSVARMNPPHGGDMHWSRLVDVPIAGLIKFFSLFTDLAMAERLAVIVWPTLLLVLLVLVMAKICERVVPAGNRLVTLLFTVMCVPAVVEFAPGRIDHHNVQILLFACALLGLVNRDTKWGHYTIGAAVGASFAIGVDSVLLLSALLAFLGLDWAIGRDGDGEGLLRTGLAMSLSVVLLCFLSVPPHLWLVPRADALSIFFVGLLLLASAGFCLLYLASSVLPRPDDGFSLLIRIGAGCAVASIVITAMYLLFGDILTGDFAGISPELQARWLKDIIEAKSLPALLLIKPDHWLSTVAYAAVLIAAGLVTLRHAGPERAHMVTIFAMLVLSIAATLFQFRLYRMGVIASIPVCAAFLHAAQARLHLRFADAKLRFMVAISAVTLALLAPMWIALSLLIPGSGPAVVAAAVPQDENTTGAAPQPVAGWRDADIYPVCNRASQYGFLARQAPGLVISDLNSATPVLVFTGHSILASNYHRNGGAILQTLNFFETDTKTAKTIARGLKADYVGFCDPGALPPAGPGHDGKLAARILKGDLPPWLRRISPPKDRYMVLKVLRDKLK